MKLTICVAAVSLLAAFGCGHAATAPSETPATSGPSPAGPGRVDIAVTDGWTGAAVVNAHVTAEGFDALTDGSGRVSVTTTQPSCLAVTIEAVGFLQRRTCAASSITMWPAATEEEVAATRSAAFFYDRRLSYMADPVVVRIGAELPRHSDVFPIWSRAAAELRADSGDRILFSLVDFPIEEGLVVSAAAGQPTCDHPWFTWSFDPAGFCWARTSDYFVQGVTVAPELLAHPEVALRALAYGTLLREHSFPGLLNQIHPALELSEFEKKTVHMLSLRARVAGSWPDADQITAR